MRKIQWAIILLNLLILLFYYNYSIAKKEAILSDGKLILLALAPVDPRSLMQGDYMQLRYEISTELDTNDITKRGYCVVKMDSNQVASRVRFQEETTPLHAGEYLIEYTSPNKWSISIGAESYFFQEGKAEKYEAAKYGGLKVDDKGNTILVGLYDEKRKKID